MRGSAVEMIGGSSAGCRCPSLTMQRQQPLFFEHDKRYSAEDGKCCEYVAECDWLAEQKNSTGCGEHGNTELNSCSGRGFQARKRGVPDDVTETRRDRSRDGGITNSR